MKLVCSPKLYPYQEAMLEAIKNFDPAKHRLTNVNHVYGKYAVPKIDMGKTYGSIGYPKDRRKLKKLLRKLFGSYLKYKQQVKGSRNANR